MTNKKLILIAISGCSSSGKTTLAKLTSNAIPESILLHEDDFYKPDAEIPMNEKYQIADWDCPEALDIDAFKRELDQIKQTGSIRSKLIHNDNVDDIAKFDLSKEEWVLLERKYAELKCSDVKIVLVDGFMIFNDKELTDKFDLKIFVRAPYGTLKQRRYARAGYKTLDSFWVDPPYYFDEFVYKSYTREHKHMFLNDDIEGELKPGTEAFELLNDDNTNIADALNAIADYIVKALNDVSVSK
ncbi:unnamed protein product [Kluyveromyces dobzhanskii CBS 2104]|uniref:WGS project CCBQ000000000 data, contig 00058 n=1 Tax=Kluyveromyces dobzhanskii CBS 2104 TaxID=1427455 RepID=A0A0A8LDH3_9SACH|nr:unnamed protein product [Kluyveromyces dobzhanskii CBS 2104]